jgi:hypothetical protein
MLAPFDKMQLTMDFQMDFSALESCLLGFILPNHRGFILLN